LPSPISVTDSGSVPREMVVLADLVAVSDAQIAALAGEALVQRVGPQYRARRDFVALSQRGPALDEHVGLEQAPGADRDIGFDYAEFADSGAGPDDGFGIDARRGRHHGRWIDGHEFVL